MMYCTGGIRCELYSAVLKKIGFEEVYQLEGGVINYGLQEGNPHWKGKLFVFDDRLAVSIDGKESEPISYCIHCQNADAIPITIVPIWTAMSSLFVAPRALRFTEGCCAHLCKEGPRLRPLIKKQGTNPSDGSIYVKSDAPHQIQQIRL